ncbi:hypothetical protein BJ138DRAFT_1209902 [Hygrophoropsis aurantiaca]|uniref:Uncharacterized protein n=1 Tax=Hygrophoropsis aurantiaca TaxID=72124 RepID=A0ACB8A4A2_9AGAM|nr:hypothetical protein BJ138DRAFT_1209902 [Hygrophoropsis aurantiaca]
MSTNLHRCRFFMGGNKANEKLRAKLAFKLQRYRYPYAHRSMKWSSNRLAKGSDIESSGAKSSSLVESATTDVIGCSKKRLHNSAQLSDDPDGGRQAKKLRSTASDDVRNESARKRSVKPALSQQPTFEQDESDDSATDSFISDGSDNNDDDDDASFTTTDSHSGSAETTSSGFTDEDSKYFDDEPFEGFGPLLMEGQANEAGNTATNEQNSLVPVDQHHGHNSAHPVLDDTSLRKSTRARKITAKAAALKLEKKTMPSELDDVASRASVDNEKKTIPPESDNMDSQAKPELYLEDNMATSAMPPANDMTVVPRDDMLIDTYNDLVPLRTVVFGGTGKCGGTVMLTKWLKSNSATINERFVVSLVSFKSHEIFVNLSRVDPAILSTKHLGNGSQLAMCVSVIVVTECFIGKPGKTQNGNPKKEITGYFLAQEFERFAGVTGAVFGCQSFWTPTADSMFKFGTFVRSNNERSQYSIPAPRPQPATNMFSTTPSPSSAGYQSVRAVLSWDTAIPIYDYRSEKVFNPAIHLNPALYAKALPSHLDLPAHSLALVAYTTSKFALSTGDPGLGCNLMWAAVLGTPKGSELPDPPSPARRSVLPREPVTPTPLARARSARSSKK